jgi:hypothetical protein
MGGSLGALLLLYAGSGLGGVALWRAWLRSGRGADREVDWIDPSSPPLAPNWIRRGAFALAGAAFLVVATHPHPTVLWGLLVATLVVAAVAHLWLEVPCFPAPHRSRGAEVVLAVIAASCAVYALALHRPDADDSLYVNMAVGAMELPHLPLLDRDTLHGLFELPIVLPSYKLHSWELWNAGVARITGLPALGVFHWISAALAAALVPLAHATLFRQLTPAIWPFTTFALVVVLAAAGDTHRWYGNFAFVRMWQGKALLLFVFMPLVYAYALRFARRGDSKSWLLLAAAQISALGCSANALWAAPAGALAALVCVLRPTRAGLRQLAFGALASVYVLAAGLLLKVGMTESVAELAEPTHPIWGAAPVIEGTRTPLRIALVTVLGQSKLYAVGIAVPFVAWLACPPGPARRFAIGLPLAVAAVLLNPLLADRVIESLTGPLYWRTLWALPLPILIALVMVAPLRWPGSIGRLGYAALVAAFAFAVPEVRGFDAGNRSAVGWPQLKVGPGYRWAQSLARVAPRQSVVAPPGVSAWAPTLQDHPYPLIVRHYLNTQRSRIGEEAFQERLLMTRFVEGTARHPRAAATFEQGLDRYAVKAALLQVSATTPTAREILRRKGFGRRLQGTGMEIWVRE